MVAPLRVRELKLDNLNHKIKKKYGRTFTGAWIETYFLLFFHLYKSVAPLRVRELKHQ